MSSDVLFELGGLKVFIFLRLQTSLISLLPSSILSETADDVRGRVFHCYLTKASLILRETLTILFTVEMWCSSLCVTELLSVVLSEAPSVLFCTPRTHSQWGKTLELICFLCSKARSMYLRDKLNLNLIILEDLGD